MRIEVKVIKENKDGSADAMLDFDEEALGFLVQEGLIAMLSKVIESDKNAKAGIALRKKLKKQQKSDV